jgi:hypothetical protein
MLVAFRLAGLSALGAHYADLNALAQFGSVYCLKSITDGASSEEFKKLCIPRLPYQRAHK